LSEQVNSAPQFAHIMWHDCIEIIFLSQRGHLISSFTNAVSAC